MRQWQVDLIIQMHCAAGRSVFQWCPHVGLRLKAVVLLCRGCTVGFNALWCPNKQIAVPGWILYFHPRPALGRISSLWNEGKMFTVFFVLKSSFHIIKGRWNRLRINRLEEEEMLLVSYYIYCARMDGDKNTPVPQPGHFMGWLFPLRSLPSPRAWVQSCRRGARLI